MVQQQKKLTCIDNSGMSAGVMEKSVYVIGTVDTKGDELEFIADCLRKRCVPCVMVDVSLKKHGKSVRACEGKSFVPRDCVLTCGESGEQWTEEEDRGRAAGFMEECLEEFIRDAFLKEKMSGVIGIGGSGGTAIITPAMRNLPIGFPKVMVSTVASGDVSPYIGGCDIAFMPSVVDIAGLNRVSNVIFRNAAGMIAGMVQQKKESDHHCKPVVGMTMFGVTTVCANAIREALSEDFEVVVFHATGSGGRAMENLVDSGMIQAVIDLTTTEVADEIVGGVMSAGPKRFERIIKKKIPYVVSVGALDMVNFGAKCTVPPIFIEHGRLLHVHNSNVTLMRTSREENRLIGKFFYEKFKGVDFRIPIIVPTNGVSQISRSGDIFFDLEADKALLDELEVLRKDNPNICLETVEGNINDEAFALRVVECFKSVASNLLQEERLSEIEKMKDSCGIRAKVPEHYMVAKPLVQNPVYDSTLKRLKQKCVERKPILGAGAGTGISAKFEEAGGVDLIIAYNSGRFRMAGHGSLAGLLPFKDANAVMLEMVEELKQVVVHTPILAGVCATDPLRSIPALLKKVQELGAAGVQNFPTVGLIDGVFRQNLEETGMSYQKEVDMIRTAHEMGLLTTPYCFDREQAVAMASAGADIVVAHMGLTTSGSIGAQTSKSLQECVLLVQEIVDGAKSINPECIILCHGGPISEPKDAQFIFKHVKGIDGFYGASSMERLPVETAIVTRMHEFNSLSLQSL
eukprot:Nk52_evm18s2496 gene=Nk52_evmTU18s2496